MPLRPLAIGFVLICLALALLLVVAAVRGLRRRRWIALVATIPALCLIVLAALPTPYILGLGAPHAVFNGPAPVPTAAVAYYVAEFSSVASDPSLRGMNMSGETGAIVAIQASTGKTLWQHAMPPLGVNMFVTEDADAVYATSALVSSTRPSAVSSTEVFALDSATDALLWQRELSDTTVWSAPLLEGGMLVLNVYILTSQTPQQILAVRPTDGQQLWSVHVGLYDASASNSLQLIPSPDGRVLYDLAECIYP